MFSIFMVTFLWVRFVFWIFMISFMIFLVVAVITGPLFLSYSLKFHESLHNTFSSG
jgi:hypothetical protein